MRTCLACGRRALARKSVDRSYVLRGRPRFVRGIPALVCHNCGEAFFDHSASLVVDALLGVGRPKRRRRAA